MLNLNEFKYELYSILQHISSFTGMECAIFDLDFNLVSCTDMYYSCKGEAVHSYPLEEVLNQDVMVVSNPGTMDTCKGCRFINNCPAKLEILASIKHEKTPALGIITLSAFTDEGIFNINTHIEDYIHMLEDITGLLSLYIMSESNKFKILANSKYLKSQLDVRNDIFIICDEDGNILNSNIHKSRHFKNIFELLDKKTCKRILKSQESEIFYVNLGFFKGNIKKVSINFSKNHGYLLVFREEVLDRFKSTNYLESIITRNKEMLDIKSIVYKLASSPSSVLIQGETGTGKELIARALHYSGSRKDYPFVPINCANLNSNLFESELFGYEEGAFTGAKRGGKIGLIEMANEGTLFLDEIGDMPLDLQAKLLRVLQEKRFRRLGGSKYIDVNIRLISASNLNLREAVRQGKFREDLFYRINVLPIELPALRFRKEDIEILAYFFLNKYNKSIGKNIKNISAKSLDLLKSHSWPGNIRELENVIEYAVNMEDDYILKDHNLPSYLKNNPDRIIEKSPQDLEREQIERLLSHHGSDLKGKEKVAQALDISTRTLYRRIKEYEIRL